MVQIFSFGLPFSKHYIITESFVKVVTEISSKSNQPVSIKLCGPSGMGKSSTLAALWFYYRYHNTTGNLIPIVLTPDLMKSPDLEIAQFIIDYCPGKLFVLLSLGKHMLTTTMFI